MFWKITAQAFEAGDETLGFLRLVNTCLKSVGNTLNYLKKCLNTDFFCSVLSSVIRKSPSVFILRMGKYGPGKPPYMDTFDAVLIIRLFSKSVFKTTQESKMSNDLSYFTVDRLQVFFCWKRLRNWVSRQKIPF